MTAEERAEAFKRGVADLERRYGYTVIITMECGGHEQGVLVKPLLQVAPIQNWQAPQDDTNDQPPVA